MVRHDLTLVNLDGTGWPDEVDRLRSALGAPRNPHLFPPHFLKATFPKIGGQAVRVEEGGALVGAGFLFPRGLEGGRRVSTLRYHPVPGRREGAFEPIALAGLVSDLLDGARVVFYDPSRPQTYERTSRVVEGVDIGTPDAAEAGAMRALAAEIWGSEPDALYPRDIASREFGAGTTLVARLDGEVVGFLFGFVKFGGSPLPGEWETRFRGGLRLESQLLGVRPSARQHGIGALLKRLQAAQARERGIAIVNWTVDPLQFGNAVLNLGRLRALAWDFYPDYYAFRNALNQVPASRLGITWLVETARVRDAVAAPRPAAILDLHDHPEIRRVNDGPLATGSRPEGPAIAIEVPGDWTRLQHNDVALASRWRATTDEIFAQYLGHDEGRYCLTGVAKDGDRTYLIAEQIGQGFHAGDG